MDRPPVMFESEAEYRAWIEKGAEPERKTQDELELPTTERRILERVRGMSDADAAKFLGREYKKLVPFTQGLSATIAMLLGRSTGRLQKEVDALRKRVDEMETLLLEQMEARK